MSKSIFEYKFVRFFLTGGVAYLVDLSFLIIFKAFIFNGENVTVLGIISLPQLFAAILGLSVSFLLNKLWVFKSKKNVKLQLTKFILVSLLNALLASILFTVYYSAINSIYFVASVDDKIIVTFSSVLKELTKMGFSYFLYNSFVFKDKL